jgi:hypothetical protein
MEVPMSRRPALLLPVFVPLALAACLGVRAAGGEEPKPAAAPAGVERLADALLVDVPAARALAESRLSSADPDMLRALVGVLRDRLLEARRPGAGAAMLQPDAPVVTIRQWVVEVPGQGADALLAGFVAGTDGVRRMPLPEFRTWLAAESGAGRITAVSESEVTTHLGRAASLSVEDRTAFVGEFELREAGPRRAAEPVIEQIVHGDTFNVTPRRLGKGWRLDVALDRTRLVKPLATWQGVPFEGVPAVTLQLPEVRTTRWSRRVVAEPGSVLLLPATGDGPGAGGKGMLVFLAAR